EADVDTGYSLTFRGGGPSFALYVEKNAIIVARRSAVMTERAPPSLGGFAEAVGRQEISLGAVLGAARIGLTDLSRLGVGDVIVLDQGVDKAARLTVDSRLIESAGALVRRAASGLELVIAQTEPQRP